MFSRESQGQNQAFTVVWVPYLLDGGEMGWGKSGEGARRGDENGAGQGGGASVDCGEKSSGYPHRPLQLFSKLGCDAVVKEVTGVPRA